MTLAKLKNQTSSQHLDNMIKLYKTVRYTDKFKGPPQPLNSKRWNRFSRPLMRLLQGHQAFGVWMQCPCRSDLCLFKKPVQKIYRF
jgi:hypothetical protein